MYLLLYVIVPSAVQPTQIQLDMQIIAVLLIHDYIYIYVYAACLQQAQTKTFTYRLQVVSLMCVLVEKEVIACSVFRNPLG